MGAMPDPALYQNQPCNEEPYNEADLYVPLNHTFVTLCMSLIERCPINIFNMFATNPWTVYNYPLAHGVVTVDQLYVCVCVVLGILRH